MRIVSCSSVIAIRLGLAQEPTIIANPSPLGHRSWMSGLRRPLRGTALERVARTRWAGRLQRLLSFRQPGYGLRMAGREEEGVIRNWQAALFGCLISTCLL